MLKELKGTSENLNTKTEGNKEICKETHLTLKISQLCWRVTQLKNLVIRAFNLWFYHYFWNEENEFCIVAWKLNFSICQPFRYLSPIFQSNTIIPFFYTEHLRPILKSKILLNYLRRGSASYIVLAGSFCPRKAAYNILVPLALYKECISCVCGGEGRSLIHPSWT